jgi:hypothetical protein
MGYNRPPKMRSLKTVAVVGALLALAVVCAAPAAAEAPHNSSAPTIEGNAVVGATLTGNNGSWLYNDGTSCQSECSYTFRWQRCDASGSPCADATDDRSDQHYVVVSADAGSRLRVVVSVHKYDCNALNQDCRWVSSSASSSLTAVVPGSPQPPPPPKTVAPASSAAPALSGTAREGQTLTATVGSWSNGPTGFAFQWRRCDASGSGCTAVSGATSESYVLSTSDLGHRVQVVVTASNAGGSASAGSAPSDVVVGIPPVNTELPTVAGTPWTGETLTAAVGTWNALPPTDYAFQWQRCYAKYGCADIPGATNVSYVLGKADLDRTLRVVVTATHGGSATSAQSVESAQIQPAAPTPGRPAIEASKTVEPDRLVIARVQVGSNIRLGKAGSVTVYVKDIRGFIVHGALVSIRAAGAIAPAGAVATGTDGKAALKVRPRAGRRTVTLVIGVSRPEETPSVSKTLRIAFR